MLADHFGREPRKLVCTCDVTRRDRTHKGSWGGIPQTSMDETDVTGVIVPSDVIGLHVDALHRSLHPSLYLVGRWNPIGIRKLLRVG